MSASVWVAKLEKLPYSNEEILKTCVTTHTDTRDVLLNVAMKTYSIQRHKIWQMRLGMDTSVYGRSIVHITTHLSQRYFSNVTVSDAICLVRYEMMSCGRY